MRSSSHLSRVLFRVRVAPPAVVIIHLVRQLPAASSSQPADSGESPFATCVAHPPTRPCSQWGLPCHLRCRKCGGLLPHRFTLTRRSLRRGGQTILCCTFLGVSATGRYPALHSMELGLSSREFLRLTGDHLVNEDPRKVPPNRKKRNLRDNKARGGTRGPSPRRRRGDS